jgi:hypothetical protein
LAIASVPVAEPCQFASFTVPVTAYEPAAVGAGAEPSYVNSTVSPTGSVVAVALFGVPSYACNRLPSSTAAAALAIVSVPVAEPCQFASFTVPVTA